MPSALALRPYQHDALDAIDAAVQRGARRQLVSLPTGTGKTVIFAHLIHQQPGRSLILVHRDELIEQAIDKLALVDPLMDIGVVKAARNALDHRVLIASVQTLARRQRMEQMGTDFALVVVDEAHHSTALSYELVLEYLSCFEAYGPLTVGFTATPERGDRQPLGHIFEEIVYQKTIIEMIPEYLSDLRAVAVQLKVDFNTLHVHHGEYRADEVEEMLFAADTPDEVAQAYLAYARGRKTLIFSPSVALAHAMVESFHDRGIDRIEAIDGTMPLDDRRAVLHRLHSGTTQIVSNCFVLAEGFDEPSIDCIIIARPTRSRSTYVQMVGRGTRRYPGKEDCLILDMVGVTDRHDLMTIQRLFNLKSQTALTEKTVKEAIDEEDRSRRMLTAVPDLDDAERVVTVVDNLFRRRPMSWLTVGDAFTLNLGDQGWIALRPDGHRWGVWKLDHQAAMTNPLIRGLSLEYAQGYGEDYARQCGSAPLTWRQASWRQKALSEYPKMERKLRWLNIPIIEGMSAGEASDLIGQAELRKRLSTSGEVSHG